MEKVYELIKDIDNFSDQINAPMKPSCASLKKGKFTIHGKQYTCVQVMDLLNEKYVEEQELEKKQLKTERAKFMHDLRVEFQELDDDE